MSATSSIFPRPTFVFRINTPFFKYSNGRLDKSPGAIALRLRCSHTSGISRRRQLSARWRCFSNSCSQNCFRLCPTGMCIRFGCFLAPYASESSDSYFLSLSLLPSFPQPYFTMSANSNETALLFVSVELLVMLVCRKHPDPNEETTRWGMETKCAGPCAVRKLKPNQLTNYLRALTTINFNYNPHFIEAYKGRELPKIIIGKIKEDQVQTPRGSQYQKGISRCHV